MIRGAVVVFGIVGIVLVILLGIFFVLRFADWMMRRKELRRLTLGKGPSPRP